MVTSVCLVFAGAFLVVGMIGGVWKWRRMLARGATDPSLLYVDTLHRAGLLYSFAALVLMELARASPWPDALETGAALGVFVFFTVALGTYGGLAWRGDPISQFKDHNFFTTTGMVVLIFFELGGTLVLFAGALAGLFGGGS